MNTKFDKKSIFKPASLLGVLLLASMLLAACASAAPSSSSNTPGAYNNPGSVSNTPVQPTAAATALSTQPSTGGAAGEATINVATDPNLGQILVDGKGMTLYVFDKDTPDTSNCNASCLAKWPPLLTQGTPTLGTGVNQSMIGTTKTTDGHTMVTYNHRPLYYYALDKKPGDTLGQGVGSIWFVIGPDGMEITK